MAAEHNDTDYQNPFQVFVEVNADFYDDGTITLRSFVWEDGRRFDSTFPSKLFWVIAFMELWVIAFMELNEKYKYKNKDDF